MKKVLWYFKSIEKNKKITKLQIANTNNDIKFNVELNHKKNEYSIQDQKLNNCASIKPKKFCLLKTYLIENNEFKSIEMKRTMNLKNIEFIISGLNWRLVNDVWKDEYTYNPIERELLEFGYKVVNENEKTVLEFKPINDGTNNIFEIYFINEEYLLTNFSLILGLELYIKDYFKGNNEEFL